MTRHELARLRSAFEAITVGATDRQRRRGVVAIEELMAEARQEHETEDRQHYQFGALIPITEHQEESP